MAISVQRYYYRNDHRHDVVLAQTPAPNSALFDEGCDCSSGDYFHAAHPDTDWAVCLEHAEKIGIGTRAYELIKI